MFPYTGLTRSKGLHIVGQCGMELLRQLSIEWQPDGHLAILSEPAQLSGLTRRLLAVMRRVEMTRKKCCQQKRKNIVPLILSAKHPKWT
jgi:hypothetical protein